METNSNATMQFWIEPTSNVAGSGSRLIRIRCLCKHGLVVVPLLTDGSISRSAKLLMVMIVMTCWTEALVVV